MQSKVFSVTGNKCSSLLIDEYALKFSSQQFDNISAFQEAWEKKLMLATKLEVKYDKIRSVSKNDNESDIKVWYRSWSGLSVAAVFSFFDANDYQTFFEFFEKQLYYRKTYHRLKPLKAISSYLIGLALTIVFSIFAYYEAMAISNGTAERPRNGKGMIFNYVLGLLGEKGVIAVGCIISIFIIYRMRTSFFNPPLQLKYLPPHL